MRKKRLSRCRCKQKGCTGWVALVHVTVQDAEVVKKETAIVKKESDELSTSEMQDV